MTQPSNLKSKSLAGKLALVTGASSGIGLCISRELASRGCSLIMVSNQNELLLDKAIEVAREFDVAVQPFYCDLTDPHCAELIMDFIKADRRLRLPDFLINNAGIFSFEPVVEIPTRRLNCFIDLHVRAVTELCRTFGREFARRGSGRILNMSSMSCWMPMPGIAMYSATKAYIRVFSRALHYELRDRKVSVTVACPGGIATDLFGLSPSLKKLAVRIGAITEPEKFAANVIDRMLKGKRQYINGLINRLAIVFVAATPTWVRMMIKRRMLDKGIRR